MRNIDFMALCRNLGPFTQAATSPPPETGLANIVDTNSPMPRAKYYISHNLRLQRTIPCVGGASRQMRS